jgi:hypothetical protein
MVFKYHLSKLAAMQSASEQAAVDKLKKTIRTLEKLHDANITIVNQSAPPSNRGGV